MARKQSDYLDGLLDDADNEAAPVAPPGGQDTSPALPPAQTAGTGPVGPVADRPRGMTLLARESALARIASGEVRQVTQLLLDPARVKVWPGNARNAARLTADNCRDLIDSIQAEGGQKVPAVVRRMTGEPGIDYEVIAGTRRHFAISWLRNNNYPDFSFLATVQTMDDETAFRLADLENRARKDVTDLERARNYLDALSAHYAGHMTQMAERLRLSKGWLSKMLSVGRLPDAVLDAFPAPDDVQLKPTYPLAQLYGASDAAARLIRAEAARIMAERDNGAELPAPEVLRRLMAAPTSMDPPVKAPLYEVCSRYGRPLLTVASANRQGLTLRIHNGSGGSLDELVEQVKAALSALAAQGRGFQQ
jgi:ParB family transcriptional regulator, chromosome partitioning protein